MAHMLAKTDPAVDTGQYLYLLEGPSVHGSLPAPAMHRNIKRARARLAPWQTKLAKDMMIAQRHRTLPLTEIADRLGMSVNHFIKAFRNGIGTAPYQWFMQQRIAHAILLLREDALPISTIASECGFADQSHFNKAFKMLMGIAPGRWRRRYKNGLLNANDQQRVSQILMTGDDGAIVENSAASMTSIS